MTKKILLFCFLLSQFTFAQIPQSFKYQSVVRDAAGVLAVNHVISVRTSILAGSASGSIVYMESQNLSTNDYGVVSLNIGAGTVVSGNFATINWGATDYFVKTELDINGGNAYIFMGTSQILSVPYALYAEKAGNSTNDHDTSATNELQNLTVVGNNLSISNGNTIALPPDADSNPTNELQNLSVNGHSIAISNGNSMMLPQDTLNIIGYTLGISNGNIVNLPPPQNLSVNGHSINITNGNTIVLPHDTLAVAGYSLGISHGNIVNLPPPQNLSIIGDSLHISSGNTIYLSGAVDLDSNPTNELQNLFLNQGSLNISNRNTVHLPDSSSTNELQNLTINQGTISISNGNSIVIPDSSATNEIQNISISNDTIKLSKNGGTIKLPSPTLSYSQQLYSRGTGIDGNFTSVGNTTLTSTKNYINFHLHVGDTLFIINTAMLKIQDSCIIEGVIMGKGRAIINDPNTIGGTGGGGGGSKVSTLSCYAGSFNGAGYGTALNVSIDQFSPPINLPGGIPGIVSISINPLTQGGAGQSFPFNLYPEALNSVSLPYLNGLQGGTNAYNVCTSLLNSGGSGGAGCYLVCKYFLFTGTINLDGANGINCSTLALNLPPCYFSYGGTGSGGGTGGGGGGAAIIKTNNVILNTGNISVSGGIGGMGGNATATSTNPSCSTVIIGSNGGNGGNGGYLIIVE